MLAGLYALQLSSFPLLAVGFCAVLAVAGKWRMVGCCLLGLLLFFAAASSVVDRRLATEFEGDSMLVLVRVVDFPKRDESSVSMVLDPVDDARLRGRLRASWFNPPAEPRLGDVWQFELRLIRPRSNSNPGGSDFEGWLLREEIIATGYVVSGVRNMRLASSELAFVDRHRRSLTRRIQAAVSEEDHAAVLVAIALGTRHLLSPEQWERYAQTGTSHLMAISGLHVGLAAMAAYVCASMSLACVGVCRNNHKIALLLALLVAGAYVVVSGFAVPAQRALLMLLLAALTVLRGRQVHPPRLLATACVVVVATDPLATMEQGFKLSFSAVALLVWLSRRHSARYDDRRFRPRPAAAFRQLTTMQFLLLLGLSPLTVLLFDRIALLAPPVNLLAVPMFSFVTVPATLLGTFTGLDSLLRISALSIAGTERAIGLASHLQLAEVTTTAIGGFAWFFLWLTVTWALMPPGWPGRKVAWVAMLAVLCWTPPAPVFGCCRIVVLDVGQGLSVVMQTHRDVSVYDTGPAYRSGDNEAVRTVIPFLRSRGVRRIDRMLVSHSDLDHSGGLGSLLAELPIGEVMLGEPVAQFASVGRPCLRGDEWMRDGIRFRVLHPEAREDFNGNNASCVLLVEAGRHAFVITGDIEAPAEQALVRDGSLVRARVATVPHHGSRTSSTSPLVERLAPDVAIVAAGHRNRWGFPKPDVLRRWQEQGATVLSTVESGAISFDLCQRSGLGNLQHARQQRWRFWHEP